MSIVREALYRAVNRYARILRIDRNIITAKDYDEFLKLMQDAGYEIKTGKYISFRAEGQERFTRAKTIGENYSEERIKERIQGHNPRKRQMQTTRKGVSLIIDIQNSIKAQESKGYEHWAKINNLKEAAKTLNYLTENNLLQYADLEKKVEDIHSSYARTGEELKSVEARLREVQPLIKNISNYQKLKPVYALFVLAARHQIVDVRESEGFGELIPNLKNAIRPDVLDWNKILHLSRNLKLLLVLCEDRFDALNHCAWKPPFRVHR